MYILLDVLFWRANLQGKDTSVYEQMKL